MFRTYREGDTLLSDGLLGGSNYRLAYKNHRYINTELRQLFKSVAIVMFATTIMLGVYAYVIIPFTHVSAKLRVNPCALAYTIVIVLFWIVCLTGAAFADHGHYHAYGRSYGGSDQYDHDEEADDEPRMRTETIITNKGVRTCIHTRTVGSLSTTSCH